MDFHHEIITCIRRSMHRLPKPFLGGAPVRRDRDSYGRGGEANPGRVRHQFSSTFLRNNDKEVATASPESQAESDHQRPAPHRSFCVQLSYWKVAAFWSAIT